MTKTIVMLGITLCFAAACSKTKAPEPQQKKSTAEQQSALATPNMIAIGGGTKATTGSTTTTTGPTSVKNQPSTSTGSPISRQ